MKLTNKEMERENEFVAGCILFPLSAIVWTIIIGIAVLFGLDLQKLFENDNGIKMALFLFSYYVFYKLIIIILRED